MKPFSSDYVWGKISKNDQGEVTSWLSLEDHCTDVAVVFRELCNVPGIRRQLNAAAETPLQEGQIERLTVLAYLHDLGKCNHGFRRKASPDGKNLAGHVQEVGVFLSDRELQPDFLEAIAYSRLQDWCDSGEGVLRLLLSSVSHHGKPIEPEAVILGAQKRHWQSHETIHPIEDIHHLFTVVKERFPQAFNSEIEPLRATAALQHTLCGLVTLADWIGSHAEHFFPFDIGEQERLGFSRSAARDAVKQIGLDGDAIRHGENFYIPFGGHLNPNNRWIQLTRLIPWEEFEEQYAEHFVDYEMGAPAKPFRMVLGALLIKEKLGITDRVSSPVLNCRKSPEYNCRLRLNTKRAAAVQGVLVSLDIPTGTSPSAPIRVPPHIIALPSVVPHLP